MKKELISILCVCVLFGCGSSVPLEIEQTVKFDSCVEQTFIVQTVLWCNACGNRVIEGLWYDRHLKASQVDSVKAVQILAAEIAYERAEEALIALGKLKAPDDK